MSSLSVCPALSHPLPIYRQGALRLVIPGFYLGNLVWGGRWKGAVPPPVRSVKRTMMARFHVYAILGVSKITKKKFFFGGGGKLELLGEKLPLPPPPPPHWIKPCILGGLKVLERPFRLAVAESLTACSSESPPV